MTTVEPCQSYSFTVSCLNSHISIAITNATICLSSLFKGNSPWVVSHRAVICLSLVFLNHELKKKCDFYRYLRWTSEIYSQFLNKKKLVKLFNKWIYAWFHHIIDFIHHFISLLSHDCFLCIRILKRQASRTHKTLFLLSGILL